MNPYSRLIPRLNGKEIEERFDYYLGLVKKGVAGFIVFGGELETVRAKMRELQGAAHYPLIIASDLEQGLGQQIEGGTVFPPAMAVAAALKGVQREEASAMLDALYIAFADEAHYAGINTILAPVLDINTNPDNPIIATRAFGEDPVTVSFFGCEMIRVLQQNGIVACGKHFPGHGDTQTDSHVSLPVVKRDLTSLERGEFAPFRMAIDENVGMIMLGHLSVPALDPSGNPVSLSDKAVAYLRTRMGFQGTVITDAMNMGGLGAYKENEASIMALNAGADFVLHPSDPDAVASYMGLMNYSPDRILHPPSLSQGNNRPFSFASHREYSERLTNMAITVEGEKPVRITRPFVIVLSDEKAEKGSYLINALRHRYPALGSLSLFPEEDLPWASIPGDCELIVAVFSTVKAWKARSPWLSGTIKLLEDRARLILSFGNPYLLRGTRTATRIYAYWDSRSAQEALAGIISA